MGGLPRIARSTGSERSGGATGLATPAAASPPPPYDCTTLSTGEIACGTATASFCSGFGAGFATGPVEWTLRLTTTNPFDTTDYSSPGGVPAFAIGGPTRACTTGTCTWATLYANFEVVAQSDGVC